MQIKEARENIEHIISCMNDIEECQNDVESFKLALTCMNSIPRIKEVVDVLYTLASRHYQSGIMDEIQMTIEALEEIK